jgi:hypothetical protein
MKRLPSLRARGEGALQEIRMKRIYTERSGATEKCRVLAQCRVCQRVPFFTAMSNKLNNGFVIGLRELVIRFHSLHSMTLLLTSRDCNREE